MHAQRIRPFCKSVFISISLDLILISITQSSFPPIAVSLGILCGLIALGISGSAIRNFYRTRTRDRKDAEFRSAVARASFVSRSNRTDGEMSMIEEKQTSNSELIEGLLGGVIDRRSEWLRLGLDSPSLIFPKKSALAKQTPVVIEKRLAAMCEVDYTGTERSKSEFDLLTPRNRRSYAPIARSPLGSAPVWTVSPSAPEEGAHNEPSDISPIVGPTISVPSIPSLNLIPKDAQDSQDPWVIPNVDPVTNEALHDILSGITERDGDMGNQDDESTSSHSSVADSDDSTAETTFTVPELVSYYDETFVIVDHSEYLEQSSSTTSMVRILGSDSTSVSIPLFSFDSITAESKARDADPTLQTTALGVSFSSLLEPSSSYLMHSTIPSTSSSSLPILRDPSIQESCSVLPLRSASSSISMLKDGPLPPPSILVSPPSMASLRTRARTIFEAEQMLTDTWDDEDCDNTEDHFEFDSYSFSEWGNSDDKIGHSQTSESRRTVDENESSSSWEGRPSDSLDSRCSDAGCLAETAGSDMSCSVLLNKGNGEDAYLGASLSVPIVGLATGLADVEHLPVFALSLPSLSHLANDESEKDFALFW